MDDQSRLKTDLAADGLSAWLIVPEDFASAALTPERCEASLREAGVEVTSKTKELIYKFIATATAAGVSGFRGLAAEGTPPQHGEDGRIEWLTGNTKADQATDAQTSSSNPEHKPNASVSFYDRSIYTIVELGQVVAKIHQPTTGVDGRDITGKNLAASDGKAIELKHDDTLLTNASGEVIAQMEGVLDRSNERIGISDTIQVNEYVDFNTGNIRFNGNVLVHKGVRDLFEIKADRDIEVRGLIEAAKLFAGGDLRARGGFAGREQGTAYVAGDLEARYLDAVELMVRGSLRVEREIINCKTDVLGALDSPHAALIGGQTRVAGEIEIGELGAEGMPLTTVYLASLPHLDPLIDELEDVQSFLIEKRQKLVKEQDLLQSMGAGRQVATNLERLTELMYEVAEAQTLLDRAEPSLQRAMERADAMRHVQLVVHKHIFANTVLISSGLRYRINDDLRGPVRITANAKGALQIEVSGSEPKPLARLSDLSDAA